MRTQTAFSCLTCDRFMKHTLPRVWYHVRRWRCVDVREGRRPVVLDLCCHCCLVSRVWLFGTPWTVAHQAPLSTGFSRPRILEWAALSSSRGASRPKGRTCVSCVSCTGRWILCHTQYSTNQCTHVTTNPKPGKERAKISRQKSPRDSYRAKNNL